MPDWSSHNSRITLLFLSLITSAVWLCYSSSMGGWYFFDGASQIETNEQITELLPLREMFGSARGVGAQSFRLNAAWNQWRGLEPIDTFSFRVVNVTIHTLCAFLLFSITRRTLARHAFSEGIRQQRTMIAFCIAIAWAVHPLNTQAVSYIIQRYESLMGLFFLATVYTHLRAVDASTWPRAIIWHAASLTAFLLGFKTKQVIVVAPMLLMLHDWTFAKAKAPEASNPYAQYVRYVGLTCLMLGALLSGFLQASTAGHTAGFQLNPNVVTPVQYMLSEGGVILHYIRLVFWPNPLIFDYYWLVVKMDGSENGYILTTCLPILAMLCLTAYAIVRRHWLGFAGAWFFLILGPTSSVVPIVDVCVEHRMYLPSIAVILVAVGAIVAARDRLAANYQESSTSINRLATLIALAVTIALGARTYVRNADYGDPTSLWIANIRDRPDFPRAYCSVGLVYDRFGEHDTAVAYHRKAVELYPTKLFFIDALGSSLRYAGKPRESLPYLQVILDRKPDNAHARRNLAFAYAEAGMWEEARQHLETLHETDDHVNTHIYLGTAYAASGELDKAEQSLRRAILIDATDADAHEKLGQVLNDIGKDYDDAIDALQAALRIDPRRIRAFHQLKRACAAASPPQDPVGCYVEAAGRHPAFSQSARRLAQAYRQARSLELRDPALADRLEKAATAMNP